MEAKWEVVPRGKVYFVYRDGVSWDGPFRTREIAESIMNCRIDEEAIKTPNLINHPPHYADLTPEPIDVIESWQLGFHEANALKYIARARSKGSEEQDLRKAAWYLIRKADKLASKGAT